MNRELERLKIAGNDYIESVLTPKARRQIRLAHIFKKAALVIYKDVQKNPIKLLCFSTFPTTTAAATLAWIGAGITNTSREYRRDLKDAFNSDLSYKLYLNFFSAQYDGQYAIDFKALRRHMRSQGGCLLMQNLLELSDRYKDGWMKKKIQKNLRKFVVKGELALVS